MKGIKNDDGWDIIYVFFRVKKKIIEKESSQLIRTVKKQKIVQKTLPDP